MATVRVRARGSVRARVTAGDVELQCDLFLGLGSSLGLWLYIRPGLGVLQDLLASESALYMGAVCT